MDGIIVFIILSVFIAGLMVAERRNSGKKDRGFDEDGDAHGPDLPAVVLVFTGISVVAPNLVCEPRYSAAWLV